MKNGQLHDDKLFQGLHDRLSDYEAPYDGADWDAMSRELDKLPKSNPFRWKFSLNTIGIVLGIAGLTAIGVVMASGNSKSTAPAAEKQTTIAAPVNQVTVTQPQQQNEIQQSVSVNASAQNSVAVNETPADNQSLIKGDRKTQKSPFFFPDQIDPVKGFVYKTHEDPALLKDHQDIKRPEVYYDIVNGKVTPILIPKDSIKETWINTIDTSSAKDTKSDDASPAEGERQGFGDDESQTF